MGHSDRCLHLNGTCEQFLDHTAAMIVAVATAAHPDDPAAACELALSSVEFAAGPEACRPMDTTDLDPETGEEYGVGPDIEYEEELAYRAEQELEEQEAER
jgi:hypothetical protein